MNGDIFEGLRKLAGTGVCAIPKTHMMGVLAPDRSTMTTGQRAEPYYADIFKITPAHGPRPVGISDTFTSTDMHPESTQRADMSGNRGSLDGDKLANDAEFAYTQVVSMVPVRRRKPVPTINDVIALVKLPFVVATDSRGPIHDESSVALKCERGHLHKYFLRDLQIALGGASACTRADASSVCPAGNAAAPVAGIIKKTKQARANAPLQCPSCAGKKSITRIRELFEDALGVPFLIMQKRVTAEAGSIEYFNHALNITIVCMQTHGADKREWIGDNMVLRIHSTDSPRKVKTSIYEFLHDAKLHPDASARVLALAPPVRKWPEQSEEPRKYGKEPRGRNGNVDVTEQFEPDNLPLTPDLAAQFLEDTQIAPWGFINNTIVNDPAMMIENCFVDEL